MSTNPTRIYNIRKVEGYCIEPARKASEVLRTGMGSLAGDDLVVNDQECFLGLCIVPGYWIKD